MADVAIVIFLITLLLNSGVILAIVRHFDRE